MATKKDLGALIDKANKASRDSTGPRWTPEDGQKFSFRVVGCTTKTDKAGYPYWNLQLEATKGDDRGRRTWAYHGFSDEWEFITQRTIDNFETLGVKASSLHSTDPAVIVEMLKGQTGVAVASVRDSDNPNRPYVNFDFEASRKVAPDDEDDEPRKKKKKKSKKKAKPEPEPEPEEEDDEFEDEEEDEFDDYGDDDDDDEPDDDD